MLKNGILTLIVYSRRTNLCVTFVKQLINNLKIPFQDAYVIFLIKIFNVKLQLKINLSPSHLIRFIMALNSNVISVTCLKRE